MISKHSDHRAAATVAREVRCGNRGCPSARRGLPALICVVEAPRSVPLVVRTRCRRCKTFQRIQLPTSPSS